MNEALRRAAVALARSWVRLYTYGTDPETAERRRAEFESDLWESLHEAGRPAEPTLRSIEILDRLLRGVPADLVWRFEALRAPARSSEAVADWKLRSHVESRPLTRTGTVVFQGIATIAILGAVTEVTVQLLRIGDFGAAIPLEEPWQVGVLVAIYCIPPLTALAACALAVPLVIRAQRLEEARTLALFLAFLSLFWATVFSFFYFLPSTEPDRLNFGLSVGPGASAWAYTWYVLAVASFLRFSALFPRRLTARGFVAGHRWKVVATLQKLSLIPAVVWGAGVALILTMAAPVVGTPWNPLGSAMWNQPAPPIEVTWNVQWVLAVFRMALGYVVVPLCMIALGVLNLFSSLVTSTGHDRRRGLWVFVGFSIAMWMVFLAIPLAFIDEETLPVWLTGWSVPFVLLAPAVIVACLAVAIFYRGDLDPALIIRRSTVYGLMAVLFVVLLAVGESLVSDLFVDRIGLSDAAGGALVAGITALLVLPLRGRFRNLLDRIGPRSGVATDVRPPAVATRAFHP